MIAAKSLRRLLTLALPLSLLFASSCGKGGSSADIDITVAPKQPIVISTDLKLGDETVTAPWIYAAFRFTNNSKKVMTLLVIRFDSRGTLDGAPARQEVEYTSDDETGDGTLVKLLPGETKVFPAYFDGLVKTTNDSFSVRATFIGWFSDPSVYPDVYNPDERFEKIFSFYAK